MSWRFWEHFQDSDSEEGRRRAPGAPDAGESDVAVGASGAPHVVNRNPGSGAGGNAPSNPGTEGGGEQAGNPSKKEVPEAEEPRTDKTPEPSESGEAKSTSRPEESGNQGAGSTRPEEPGPGDEYKVCPRCGARVQAEAKYCTQCAAPFVPGATSKPVVKGKRRIKAPVQPWAVEAGSRFSRLPWGVKYGIPIAILLIIAVVVGLFVVAGMHSPSAVVKRYLNHLEAGEYEKAYELVMRQGGEFSTYKFFRSWQETQVEELGTLVDYKVKPRPMDSRLFGMALRDDEPGDTPFVVTLRYKKKTIDVNITADETGGFWPLRKYRLKLSEQPCRARVSARGADITLDDVAVGKSEPDEDLQNAMSLGSLPGDLDEAITYVKNLYKTFEYFVEEAKSLARKLDNLIEEAERIFNKVGSTGVAWSEVIDSVNRLVDQSKEFGTSVARAAIKVYWVFGGGDDGSIRAEMTRADIGVDLTDLPEGYHKISAELQGAKKVTKEFIAPESVDLTLEPTRDTEKELRRAVETYHKEVSDALFNVDPSRLGDILTGDLLKEIEGRVKDLATQGLVLASELTALKFEEAKLLSADFATVKTQETWNFTTLQGPAPVESSSNVKETVVYTLKRDSLTSWKVIERKADRK